MSVFSQAVGWCPSLARRLAGAAGGTCTALLPPGYTLPAPEACWKWIGEQRPGIGS